MKKLNPLFVVYDDNWNPVVDPRTTWEKVADGVENAIDNTGDALHNAAVKTDNTVDNAVEDVKEFWRDVRDGAANAVENTADAVANAWHNLKEGVKEIWRDIKEGAQDLAYDADRAMWNTDEKIAAWAENVVEGTKNVVAWTAETVWKVATAVGTEVVETGKNVVGFAKADDKSEYLAADWEQTKERAWNVVEGAKNVVAGAVDAVKNVVSGAKEAIDNTADNVTESAQKVGSKDNVTNVWTDDTTNYPSNA